MSLTAEQRRDNIHNKQQRPYYGDDPDGKSVGSNATASDGLGSLGALVSGGGLRDGNSINGGTMNGNGGGRSVVGSISSAAEDILAAKKIAAAETSKARLAYHCFRNDGNARG
jgi:hypothetical protein